MAFRFDGSTNYLERALPSGLVATGYPMTMACWAYQTGGAAIATLMAVNDNVNAAQYFVLQVSGSGAVRAGAAAGVGQSNATTSITTPQNTWFHGAAIFTNTNSRAAFINGGGKGTVATARGVSGFNNAGIGVNRIPSLSEYLRGGVAWPAIWNAALTDGEVALLAQGANPATIRPEALVSFYEDMVNVGAGSGPIVYDRSGRGNWISAVGNVHTIPEPPQIAPSFFRAPEKAAQVSVSGTPTSEDFAAIIIGQTSLDAFRAARVVGTSTLDVTRDATITGRTVFDTSYPSRVVGQTTFTGDYPARIVGTNVLAHSQPARIVGQTTLATNYQARIVGLAPALSNLITITGSGGTVTVDADRVARIVGYTTLATSYASRVIGQAPAPTSQPARIVGQASLAADYAARVTAQASLVYSQPTRVIGQADFSANYAARLIGQSTLPESWAARINGYAVPTFDLAGRITGQNFAEATYAARLIGQDVPSFSMAARVVSQSTPFTADHPVRVVGQATLADFRNVRIVGVEPAQSTFDQTVRVVGSDTSNVTRVGRVTGADTTSASWIARITGQDTQAQTIQARVVGQLSLAYQQDVQVAGRSEDASLSLGVRIIGGGGLPIPPYRVGRRSSSVRGDMQRAIMV